MVEIVEHTESRVASVAGLIYLLLFPIPVVCFLAALITDRGLFGNRVPDVAAISPNG